MNDANLCKLESDDNFFDTFYNFITTLSILRLLAMDVSALASMKDAAYCETQCDVQNSEIHKIFERKRYSTVFCEVCPAQCLKFLHSQSGVCVVSSFTFSCKAS